MEKDQQYNGTQHGDENHTLCLQLHFASNNKYAIIHYLKPLTNYSM